MNPAKPSRCHPVVLGCILLALLPGLPRGAAAEPAGQSDVLALPNLKVKGGAKCSFGIGISFLRDAETRKVTQVFISSVDEGSSAADQGLKEGDEILAINREKVRGMPGELKRGSRLFDLLVDRPPGELIDLEVKARQVRRLTLTAVKPPRR